MEKSKFSLNRNDPEMRDLVGKTDQKTLASWAIDCAERVLPFFEEKYPEDPRPQRAIKTLKEWIKTGEFRMSVIRKASLDAHRAARDAGGDNAARSAARACGQAVAAAHVARHAYGSAIYAQQAIFRKTESLEKSQNERMWQYNRLQKLRSAALLNEK